MLIFFLLLLKNQCSKNPQLVITDTAPEILPLDDSITYNIKTDERGVVTVTTLDQDNRNVAQQEISGSSNIKNNEDIVRYAPTVEELNDSVSNPIIKLSEYPQISTDLGVNPSNDQSSMGTFQPNGQPSVGTFQPNDQSSMGTFQPNGQPSVGTFQSNGQSSVGTIESNNLPTTQLNSQSDVLLIADPSSPQNSNNQQAPTSSTNQNSDSLNSSTNPTQKSNKSTDKSKSKKDKKKKKRDTNNDDDVSEIISNGFNYNQDIVLLLIEIVSVL